jgi:multidrug efflux pump subunit AcrA (membrane-fusion protein)
MMSRAGNVKAVAVVVTALSLSLGGAGLSGCSHGGVESTAAASTEERVIPVTVQPVETRQVERTVEVVGTLKGWEQVTVGAKRGGRVMKVLHDMGDHVRPGEILIELDTVDAKLALHQAQSRYFAELTKLGISNDQAQTALKRFGITEELLMGEQATRLIEQSPAIVQANTIVDKAAMNVARVRSLYQRGAGALEELQNFENDYKTAKAAKDNAVATARNVIANAVAAKISIDSAEQAQKDLIVLVPEPSVLPKGIDRSKLTYGVTKRYVSEGQILRDGDPVMDLVIEEPLRLWSNVPERFAADVTLGQPVRVTVSSSEVPFEGTIARINPSIDPVSRTFQAEALIPNPNGALRPGGFAKASIQTEQRSEANVVPVESVVKFAGVTKVFVVDGKNARAVEVSTELEGPGWVEIRGAVKPGDLVVTTGQTQLAEGTPVLIRTPEPAKTVPAKTEPAPKPVAASAKG